MWGSCLAQTTDGVLRPPGLEPEIGFWREIFSSVTSAQGLVHDDRHLGVVYERLELPDNASSRQRRRAADKARKKYRAILDTLASGRRSGLTTEESRVLNLWPDDVSDAELRRATRRVRFQQGLADRFQAGLVRSGQWRDYIKDRLRENEVPLELAALPHVESSFNPVARSHVGAAGLWQFTRGTGRRFMQIDHVVDGRRDPFISSAAAAELLSYNYSILKSWPLAITAYNHGVAGMRRAVRKMGTEDIEAIVRGYDGRAFGFASRNFYVAFLAAVETQQNAEQYFGPVEFAAPDPKPVVTTTEYIPATALADAFGVSVDSLQDANPALLEPVWIGTKHVPRGFPVRVPEQGSNSDAAQWLAQVPAGQRFNEQTPDLFHRVQRGDSLSVIAARYRTNVRELMALNGLSNRNRIRAGQVLRLPFAGEVPAVAIDGDADTYSVRRGDTLGIIAKRSGVPADQLMALNDIDNANRIYPGQELILRGADVTPAVPSPAPVPVEQPAEPPAVAVVDDPSLAVAEPVAVAVPEAVELETTVEIIAEVPDDTALPVADTPGEQDGQALLADPADYLVSSNGSIEVQAAETLGHYADWLELKTQRLRDLNGYAFRQPVVIGRRVKLDFSGISPEEFAERRIAYHRELQEAYFTRYRVTDTQIHKLRRGESVWLLTQRRYKVPVWLLRQYNPELNLDRVRPGDQVVFPRVERVEAMGPEGPAMANAR
ncbi:MAG: LysM peptidoglycan-binding domain-containing protein [Gammaproteobacteria bacterium]